MHLTRDEFEEFKRNYRFIEWPDEDYRIPVEVEPAGDGDGWTIYLTEPEFRDAVEWLSTRQDSHARHARAA